MTGKARRLRACEARGSQCAPVLAGEPGHNWCWAWVRAGSSGGSARGQAEVTSTVNNNRREPFFLGVLVGGRYRLPQNPRTFLLDLRSPPFPRYPRRVSIRTADALVVPFEKPPASQPSSCNSLSPVRCIISSLLLPHSLSTDRLPVRAWRSCIGALPL